MNKVGQAIDDEFCYEERCKLIHDSIHKVKETIYMEFRCINDEEEEEIREVELNMVAIY
jgi:hypothetical protein